MKKKLIRVLSPITIGVFTLLDFAVIYFGYEAIIKFAASVSPITIFFLAVEIAAVIIAILVTKEIFSNGIVFYEDEMEFTGIDENNTVEYSRIKTVKLFKDNAASLVKNFNDRHTVIFFTFDNGETLSLDVGITTNRLIYAVEKELKARLSNAEITVEIKNKPDFKQKKQEKNEESTD